MKVAEVRHILDTIRDMFPDAHCELNHSNAFELTIAVLLSAQCTDATVNKVTEDLFQKYKTPLDYISVPLEELERDIRRIGLYRNKAKHIQSLCSILIEQYGGEVPQAHDLLVTLPGSAARLRMSLCPTLLAYLRLLWIPMWNGYPSGSHLRAGRIPYWKWRRS